MSVIATILDRFDLVPAILEVLIYIVAVIWLVLSASLLALIVAREAAREFKWEVRNMGLVYCFVTVGLFLVPMKLGSAVGVHDKSPRSELPLVILADGDEEGLRLLLASGVYSYVADLTSSDEYTPIRVLNRSEIRSISRHSRIQGLCRRSSSVLVIRIALSCPRTTRFAAYETAVPGIRRSR